MIQHRILILCCKTNGKSHDILFVYLHDKMDFYHAKFNLKWPPFCLFVCFYTLKFAKDGQTRVPINTIQASFALVNIFEKVARSQHNR